MKSFLRNGYSFDHICVQDIDFTSFDVNWEAISMHDRDDDRHDYGNDGRVPFRILCWGDKRHVLGERLRDVHRIDLRRMERKMLRSDGSDGGPYGRIHGRAYGRHDCCNDDKR